MTVLLSATHKKTAGRKPQRFFSWVGLVQVVACRLLPMRASTWLQ